MTVLIYVHSYCRIVESKNQQKMDMFMLETRNVRTRKKCSGTAKSECQIDGVYRAIKG